MPRSSSGQRCVLLQLLAAQQRRRCAQQAAWQAGRTACSCLLQLLACHQHKPYGCAQTPHARVLHADPLQAARSGGANRLRWERKLVWGATGTARLWSKAVGCPAWMCFAMWSLLGAGGKQCPGGLPSGTARHASHAFYNWHPQAVLLAESVCSVILKKAQVGLRWATAVRAASCARQCCNVARGALHVCRLGAMHACRLGVMHACLQPATALLPLFSLQSPCCTQDINAECIVMARHSKGRLKEFMVGSVTKVI